MPNSIKYMHIVIGLNFLECNNYVYHKQISCKQYVSRDITNVRGQGRNLMMVLDEN